MFTPLISGLSFSDILLYFLLYAIVGYMLEVIFAALVLGKFVNRGFLNGPWCPIYGFGVVVVAIALKPVSDNMIVLFIGSVIVTSAIEFVTGFVLEKVFNQRWWDYSDAPFNLCGYICLKFSLLWGFACVFVVKLIFPFTDWIASLLRNKLGAIALFSMLALMIADLVATLVSVAGIKKKLNFMNAIVARLKENSNNVGEFLSDETLELKQKFESLSAQLEKGNAKRLLNAFPNLKKHNSKRISELRKNIDESIARSRERSRENIAELRENLSEIHENIERRAAEMKPRFAITRADIPHIVVTLIIGIAIGYFLARVI